MKILKGSTYNSVLGVIAAAVALALLSANFPPSASDWGAAFWFVVLLTPALGLILVIIRPVRLKRGAVAFPLERDMGWRAAWVGVFIALFFGGLLVSSLLYGNREREKLQAENALQEVLSRELIVLETLSLLVDGSISTEQQQQRQAALLARVIADSQAKLDRYVRVMGENYTLAALQRSRLASEQLSAPTSGTRDAQSVYVAISDLRFAQETLNEQIDARRAAAAASRSTATARIGGIVIFTLFTLTFGVWQLSKRYLTAIRERSAELERLALIAKATTNAVIVTDHEQRITWVNDGFVRMSGFTLTEARGLTTRELLGGSNTRPEKLLERDQTRPPGGRVEVLNFGKGNRRYWTDVDVQLLSKEDGGGGGYMAIHADITELVEQRERLRLNVELLESIEEISGTGGWAIDLTTHEVVATRQTRRLFDQPEAEPMGIDTVLQFLAAPEQERAKAWITQAINDAQTSEHELPATTATGRSIWIRSRGRCEYLDGRPLRLIGATRDITVEKAREMALELSYENSKELRFIAQRANAAKSEFLANMSHEIRTPMTSILGYAELLDTEWVGLDRHTVIESIRRNSRHLLTLINDILDLSKIEVGKLEVASAQVNLAELLREMVGLLSERARLRGLSFELEILSALPMQITSDDLRVRQVLLNLISNAMKFTERGGIKLSVSLELHERPQDARLVLSVIDTGMGITDDQQMQLFEPFQQGNIGVARRFGGTGLGLSLSKRLAQRLGGDLYLEATSELGSTFALKLPLDQRALGVLLEPQAMRLAIATPEETRPAVSVAGLLQGVHVLIVEDCEDNRLLLAHHLTRAGARLDFAEDGLAALTLLDGLEEQPDLILTDIQMPRMDGLQLARELRVRGCLLPILAITAMALSGDAERCLQAGCNAHIKKPFEFGALIDACAAWAKAARLSRQNTECAGARH